MLKTVTAFKIEGNTRTLLNNIAANELPIIEDPNKTVWRSVGFAIPDSFGGKPVLTVDSIKILDMQIRERILPGRVIRTKLAEKIAEMSEREGRRIGRKEIASVKDELIAQLLPTTLIKPSDTLLVIYRDWLLIGSGGSRVVDTAIELLSQTFNGSKLELSPIYSLVKKSAHHYMMDILMNGTTDSGYLNRGQSVTMRSPEKAIARFKGMTLESEAVKDRIAAGFIPTELELILDDKMMFTMSDHLTLKRIAFSDIISEQISDMVGEEENGFDATAIITVKEITNLLDTLLSDDEMGDSSDEDEL